MKHFSTWPFFQSVVEFYFEKCLQHWKKPGYQTWQAMEHVFLVSNIWLFGVFIASISGGNPQQHTMNPPGFSRCVCINFLEVFYSYTPQKLTWNLKNDGCFNRNLLFVGAHFQVNHVTFSGVYMFFKITQNPSKPRKNPLFKSWGSQSNNNNNNNNNNPSIPKKWRPTQQPKPQAAISANKSSFNWRGTTTVDGSEILHPPVDR